MQIQPLKLSLVVTNFAILSFLLVLIIDHYNSSYDVRSFSSVFHVLCFLWLSIRVFWLSTMTSSVAWTSADYFFLYWMPTPLEFGSFLLLPLYFAQVLYPTEWKSYWRLLRPLYILVIVGLVSFQAIYLLMELFYQNETKNNCNGNCFAAENSSTTFRTITAVCFLGLACAQTYFALQLGSLAPHRYERYFTASPSVMAAVNGVLVLSFSTRGLYQILASWNIFILPDVPLLGKGDVPPIIFLLFELWDYVPTILVIATITSRAVGPDAQSRARNMQINQTSNKLLRQAHQSLEGQESWGLTVTPQCKHSPPRGAAGTLLSVGGLGGLGAGGLGYGTLTSGAPVGSQESGSGQGSLLESNVSLVAFFKRQRTASEMSVEAGTSAGRAGQGQGQGGQRSPNNMSNNASTSFSHSSRSSGSYSYKQSPPPSSMALGSQLDVRKATSVERGDYTSDYTGMGDYRSEVGMGPGVGVGEQQDYEWQVEPQLQVDIARKSPDRGELSNLSLRSLPRVSGLARCVEAPGSERSESVDETWVKLQKELSRGSGTGSGASGGGTGSSGLGGSGDSDGPYAAGLAVTPSTPVTPGTPFTPGTIGTGSVGTLGTLGTVSTGAQGLPLVPRPTRPGFEFDAAQLSSSSAPTSKPLHFEGFSCDRDDSFSPSSYVADMTPEQLRRMVQQGRGERSNICGVGDVAGMGMVMRTGSMGGTGSPVYGGYAGGAGTIGMSGSGSLAGSYCSGGRIFRPVSGTTPERQEVRDARGGRRSQDGSPWSPSEHSPYTSDTGLFYDAQGQGQDDEQMPQHTRAT